MTCPAPWRRSSASTCATPSTSITPVTFGHLNCPVAIAALLAETILSPINSSLDTWDQSAGGTLIEQRLIAWTAGRIGLGETADGVFTSGGTQSNLQALLVRPGERVVAPQVPKAA